MKINGVILASGFSKRMGENKLLLEYNGKSLIENIIKKLLDFEFNEIIVVTSHNEVETISNYILEEYGKNNFQIIKNKNPENGISESIKLAVNDSSECDGYMFFVGDQPFLKKSTIKKLLTNAQKDKIIIPKYLGKNGSPVIFGSIFKENLLGISGDTGGKQIIKENLDRVQYINIDNEIEGFDIDTKEDYNFLLNIKDDNFK